MGICFCQVIGLNSLTIYFATVCHQFQYIPAANYLAFYMLLYLRIGIPYFTRHSGAFFCSVWVFLYYPLPPKNTLSKV